MVGACMGQVEAEYCSSLFSLCMHDRAQVGLFSFKAISILRGWVTGSWCSPLLSNFWFGTILPV